MENNESSKSLGVVDVNDPSFYNNLQDQIETDIARLKKSVEIVRNLRITAAEMEVKTASLYHAELWRDVEDLKNTNETAIDQTAIKA